MSKVSLLAVVSALALAGQASLAAERPPTHFPGKGAKLLYNQNSNPNGEAVGSQNFTSGTYSSSDDVGADDFVVPAKTKWTITEVDVTGEYYNGPGPASSEDVIFYKDDNGVPGTPITNGVFKGLVGVDEKGSFAITLSPHSLALKPGTYWVSVIANCSYKGGCGEWAWELTKTVHGYQPMWEVPKGSRCSTWTTIETCFGYTGDLMFDLRGKSKRK